jgi:hypothetical protein
MAKTKTTQWITSGTLLAIALGIFSFIQSDPVFPDPDSFYHATMAEIMAENGPIKAFFSLPYTILSESFADHHFLYHVLLIPFTKFFPPLFGAKLASVILAASFILVFYVFLKRRNVSGAIWYSLLLIFFNAFVFRLNLTKATSFSLIILFLSLLAIIEQRYLLLFILSTLYVLSYGGFAILFLAVLLLILASVFGHLTKKLLSDSIAPHSTNSAPTDSCWKPAVSVISGIGVGLLTHPNFPQNITFYYHQLVEIGIMNLQHEIDVGGEWYPYHIFDLMNDVQPLFLLVTVAWALFSFRILEAKRETWLAFLLTGIFLIATIKSKRYVEYFVPFAVWFSASAVDIFVRSRPYASRLWEKPWQLVREGNILQILLITSFISSIFALVIGNIRSLRQEYSGEFRFDTFAGAATWLKLNTNEDEIVFHSDWDEFPMLLYYNRKNRYISGLDPTFMYRANSKLYSEYADITRGKEMNGLYDMLKNDFHVRYVFVDTTHEAFRENLENNIYFERVYRDEEGSIYKLME